MRKKRNKSAKIPYEFDEFLNQWQDEIKKKSFFEPKKTELMKAFAEIGKDWEIKDIEKKEPKTRRKEGWLKFKLTSSIKKEL